MYSNWHGLHQCVKSCWAHQVLHHLARSFFFTSQSAWLSLSSIPSFSVQCDLRHLDPITYRIYIMQYVYYTVYLLFSWTQQSVPQYNEVMKVFWMGSLGGCICCRRTNIYLWKPETLVNPVVSCLEGQSSALPMSVMCPSTHATCSWGPSALKSLIERQSYSINVGLCELLSSVWTFEVRGHLTASDGTRVQIMGGGGLTPPN